MSELDPRLHFVVATVIIVKDGPSNGSGRAKFLIAKRAPHEKAFPNKWTVPGGKLVLHEYQHLPRTGRGKMWYNAVNWVVQKEVQEEVGLKIGKISFVCDLIFVRPDGYPVVTLSFWAKYKSGQVKLCKDLTDYAWVSAKEAKKYDLIEGIQSELEEVAKLL